MTEPTGPGTSTPTPRKRPRLPWFIGGAVLALLLCFGGCGALLSAGSDDKDAATTSTPTAPQTGQPIQSPNPVYVPPTAPATTAAAPVRPATPPAPTMDDGIWTVGEDVPAGTYKVTTAVGGDCYWAITKSGTNGSDIINNDIPGGGRPKVTLKRGQDFTSQNCGTWQRVG